MTLFPRKLVFLLLLSNFFFCSLKSQLVIVPVGSVYNLISGKTGPIKIFKPYKFDTSTAIIGIDFSDSTNGRNSQFSFIINNADDLAQLKKDWVFTNGTTKSDHGIVKIFYTSNKVVKDSWVAFPNSLSIVTKEGLYQFNPTLLTMWHTKSPLVHSTRIDTLKSKGDYLKFNDSVKANPAFLFLIEPEIVCEGSFEVTLKASSHIAPEEVGERIINSCNKIKGESAFKVFMKPADGTGESTRKTYVVRCDHSLFEQFSNSEMEKGNWTQVTYVIQSFWRSL